MTEREPGGVAYRAKPTKHAKKPKEIEPHLSDPDPAAPGAVPAGWGPVNPAHLMSRLGKGQMIAWFKHLFLLCDLGVVRKRWVLSLAGPVQETIRRSRRPETSPMPVLLSSCALITLCTCSYSLSLPSETSWNTCQEKAPQLLISYNHFFFFFPLQRLPFQT